MGTADRSVNRDKKISLRYSFFTNSCYNVFQIRKSIVCLKGKIGGERPYYGTVFGVLHGIHRGVGVCGDCRADGGRECLHPELGFAGALAAGMAGGLAGSFFAYAVGHYGGRSFVDTYGHYFFIKKSHVDVAQRWFDKYGLKAVFFSRMLPVVRTFISLPAGFAHVDAKKFFLCTIAGSLPWTALILFAGMMLGKSWQVMLAIGHEASLVFVGVCVVVIAVLYLRHRRSKKAEAAAVDAE